MYLIENTKMCLTQKYATFSGRATRSEFWYFILGTIILSIVVGALSAIIGHYISDILGGLITLVYTLGLIIPSLAISVRRLHDTNKDWWFILFGLIPCIGALIMLVFYILPSDPGHNRFG